MSGEKIFGRPLKPEKPGAKEKKVDEKETPMKERAVVGGTISVEGYRRLQLIDAKPSDLEAVVKKAQAVSQYGRAKEHDWITIAIAIAIVGVIMIVVMMALPKMLAGF